MDSTSKKFQREQARLKLSVNMNVCLNPFQPLMLCHHVMSSLEGLLCLCFWRFSVIGLFHGYLRGSPVLPARRDVSDDTGVALLAHVDAVHLDDALARVQPGHGRHRA